MRKEKGFETTHEIEFEYRTIKVIEQDLQQMQAVLNFCDHGNFCHLELLWSIE